MESCGSRVHASSSSSQIPVRTNGSRKSETSSKPPDICYTEVHAAFLCFILSETFQQLLHFWISDVLYHHTKGNKMSKSAKNILFSSQREKLISHSLFLSGEDFNRITIPVFQRLFPQNLAIAFQHLRNRSYLSRKRFSKSMVLKLHLKGTSTGIVDDRRYLFKQGTAMLIFPFQPHWIMQVGTGKEMTARNGCCSFSI